MAIFAYLNTNINYPPLHLEQPVNDGDVLTYDSETGFFVNKKISSENFNFVKDAKNLGNTNSIGVFRNKTSDGILNFRSFIAGPGLNLSFDDTNIIINLDEKSNLVSVPRSYYIVIDNDNNNDNAKFEIKRTIPSSAITISVNVLPPLVVYDLYTGNTPTRGFIRSSSVNFFSLGYEENMLIEITGTGDQDGIYLIDEVVISNSSHTIYFKDPFAGSAQFNLGGPKYPTTIKQFSIYIPDNDGSLGPEYSNDKLYSIQFWNVDLSQLQQNMIVKISGTENGIVDGTYIIREVLISGNSPILEWPSLIFEPTTPLPQNITPGAVFDSDLFSNKIKIETLFSVTGTGFSVNKFGEVTGQRFFSNSLPTSNNELTRKDYVDNKINSEINNFNDIVVSALTSSVNNIINDMNDLKNKDRKTLRYYLLHAKF